MLHMKPCSFHSSRRAWYRAVLSSNLSAARKTPHSSIHLKQLKPPLYHRAGKLHKGINTSDTTFAAHTIFSHTFYFCMANPEVHFAKSPNPTAARSLSHPIPESFPRLTFCMLSRTSEVLMLPLANLNLSRLATDSSPAFGLMGGTGSPNKKISVCLVVRLGFGFWQFQRLSITKNQIWVKHNLFSSSEVHTKCHFPEISPIVSIYLRFSVEYESCSFL